MSDDAVELAHLYLGSAPRYEWGGQPWHASKLARAFLEQHGELTKLRAMVRAIPLWTQHGPNGRGESGPCSEGCLKCRAEDYVKEHGT